jgi:hypothetical protein
MTRIQTPQAPAPQAEAFAAILAVTKRDWAVATQDKAPARGGRNDHRGQTDARHPSHAARPRSQLRAFAARAFEAQVMAMRCQQAFVA